MKAQQQFTRPGAERQPERSCSDQVQPTTGPATSASPVTAAVLSQQWGWWGRGLRNQSLAHRYRPHGPTLQGQTPLTAGRMTLSI